MEQQEDISLVVRCKSGERQAFDELVLKYQRRVFSLAYRMLNNYDEANDIAQEVFVRVFRSIKGFRQDCAVFTWLYRITVNLSKNRLRVLNREKARTEALDDPVATYDGEVIKKEIADDKPLPSEIIAQKEKDALIQKAVASLEEEFREVVVLRDIEGLSYEEVACILKINTGTVKSRLHRGRAELRNKLRPNL